MKKVVFIIYILAICLPGHAQEHITIKAGTAIKDYFKQDQIYKYPEFVQGKVLLKNGVSAHTQLNYNYLMGEMHFIKPPADTLAFAEPKEILLIVADTDSFYYNNGFLLVIACHWNRKLTKMEYYKLEDIRKGDAYGMTSSTTAISNFSNYTGSSPFSYKLTANQDVIISKHTDFYIRESSDKYHLVTEKSVLREYSKYKKEVKEYIHNNHLDFHTDKDMIQLFDYLESFSERNLK